MNKTVILDKAVFESLTPRIMIGGLLDLLNTILKQALAFLGEKLLQTGKISQTNYNYLGVDLASVS